MRISDWSSDVCSSALLCLWMGEIINRTNLSTELFRGVAPWVGRLPGGLLHVNVGVSVIFAAVSGSSIATAATMGRVTMTELRERGYKDRKSTRLNSSH